jgi:glutamate synthase (ferredoxin)
MKKGTLAAIPAAALGAVAAHDPLQRRHAVLRNFPVVGHARYWLETIGPELRQYIVASTDEERPFSRDQRRWVYASAKLQNNYFGFGTDNDLEHTSGNVIVHHRVHAGFARRGLHEDVPFIGSGEPGTDHAGDVGPSGD